MTAIERINALSDEELLQQLAQCCASQRWASALLAARPFAATDELIRAAEAAFDTLRDDDWREAFAAAPPPDLQATDAGTRSAIEVALRLYQERFGYPFIGGADKLGDEELLMRVRIRLGLEPLAQLRASRHEQTRLTRICLQRMIDRFGAAPDPL